MTKILYRMRGVLWILATLWMGCADEMGSSVKEILKERELLLDSLPTEDALLASSMLKSYSFSGVTESRLARAFKKRIRNFAATIDESVETVIIPGSRMASLSEAECTKVLWHYLTGGNLVLLDASYKEWYGLFRRLEHRYSEMLEDRLIPTSVSSHARSYMRQLVEGVKEVDLDQLPEASQRLSFDILAFRGTERYVGVSEAAYQYNQQRVELDVDSEEDILQSSDTIRSFVTPTNYTVGLLADLCVKWIDTKRQADACAYSYTRPITLMRDGKYPILVTIETTAWSAYHFAEEKDFYLIRQRVDAQNGGYAAAALGESDWEWIHLEMESIVGSGIAKEARAYGAYMKGMEFSQRLCAKRNQAESCSAVACPEMKLLGVAPKKRLGASEVTKEVALFLEGEVGMPMEGPSGGRGNGLSLCERVSCDVPGRNLSQTTSERSTTWSFSGASPKQTDWGDHTLVANWMQAETWFDMVWIWEVESPETSYSLATITQACSERLVSADFQPLYMRHEEHDRYCYPLPTPSRTKSRWRIEVRAEGAHHACTTHAFDSYGVDEASATRAAKEELSKRVADVQLSISKWGVAEQKDTYTFELYKEEGGNSKKVKEITFNY